MIYRDYFISHCKDPNNQARCNGSCHKGFVAVAYLTPHWLGGCQWPDSDMSVVWMLALRSPNRSVTTSDQDGWHEAVVKSLVDPERLTQMEVWFR